MAIQFFAILQCPERSSFTARESSDVYSDVILPYNSIISQCFTENIAIIFTDSSKTLETLSAFLEKKITIVKDLT